MSDFKIPISLQPNVIDLKYFILLLLIHYIILKYSKFTTLGCKDIWILKSEFVAKTQFPGCPPVTALFLVGQSSMNFVQNIFGSEYTNVPQNKSVLFSTHLCNMRPMHISVEYVGNI